MGGSGKPNTHNPEELFGVGYAACYLSALNAVHSSQNKDAKPLPKSTTVDGFVSIGKTDVPVSDTSRIRTGARTSRGKRSELEISESEIRKTDVVFSPLDRGSISRLSSRYVARSSLVLSSSREGSPDGPYGRHHSLGKTKNRFTRSRCKRSVSRTLKSTSSCKVPTTCAPTVAPSRATFLSNSPLVRCFLTVRLECFSD